MRAHDLYEAFTQTIAATVQLPVREIVKYAVHRAGANTEIDAARKAENDSLEREIASSGVPGKIILDIDTERGLAQIADGNHRTVMANNINPNMMVLVEIRLNKGLKRPYAAKVAYDGKLDQYFNKG